MNPIQINDIYELLIGSRMQCYYCKEELYFIFFESVLYGVSNITVYSQFEHEVQPVKEQLAQSLFDHIPVGVGSKGIIPMNAR